MVSLHEYEAAILPYLADCKTVDQLISKSGLEHIKVMRGLQWLSNKKLIELNYETKQIVDLDANGIVYQKEGLPERRFLQSIKDGKEHLLDSIKDLSPQEKGVSIGTLKKKVAITTNNKDGKLFVTITDQGKKLLDKPSLEEIFLQKSFPLAVDTLADEERFALDNLKSRKQILQVDTKKVPLFTITKEGSALVKKGIDSGGISRLTPAMLKDGSWKGKTFRPFDLNSEVPGVHGAKRHYVPQAIDYIKRVWLDMGFTQMDGNIIQSAFWDLDALFVPQDHPAREEQDTFYLEKPSKGKLPATLMKSVQEAHENGGKTGSTGWRDTWSKDIAEQLLLRTHCTVLSAQTIHSLKEKDLPAKFFAVGRVFRNEAMDASHLFEFYQVEGIVIDPNVNFGHLLGYLKAFFAKLGYPDVRVRPGYFPYTEPSAEVDVWHPVYNKWIELGGSGIFRPEMVIPLFGKWVPVLAWGLGLERSIVEGLGMKDLRDIYKNDLKKNQSYKNWMK